MTVGTCVSVYCDVPTTMRSPSAVFARAHLWLRDLTVMQNTLWNVSHCFFSKTKAMDQLWTGGGWFLLCLRTAVREHKWGFEDEVFSKVPVGRRGRWLPTTWPSRAVPVQGRFLNSTFQSSCIRRSCLSCGTVLQRCLLYELNTFTKPCEYRGDTGKSLKEAV